MKLEDQVCSLELAKRLKELGVKQESLFQWRRWSPKDGSTYIDNEWRISIFKDSTGKYEVVSAFTVAELGEMLPAELPDEDMVLLMKKCRETPTHRVFYHHPNFVTEKEYVTIHHTEANARASMLIHLIENKLMELPK